MPICLTDFEAGQLALKLVDRLKIQSAVVNRVVTLYNVCDQHENANVYAVGNVLSALIQCGFSGLAPRHSNF